MYCDHDISPLYVLPWLQDAVDAGRHPATERPATADRQ